MSDTPLNFEPATNNEPAQPESAKVKPAKIDLTQKTHISFARAWREATATGLVFAAVGLLPAGHLLASATLRHIVTPGPNLSYQEVMDFLPVPRLLDWPLPLIHTLQWLEQTRGVILGLFCAVVFLVAGWLCHLVLLSPPEPKQSPAPNTGGSGRPAIRGLLWFAGLYTIVLVLLLLFALPRVSNELLVRYQTLGTFNLAYWREIACCALGSMALLWFGGGTLFAMVIRPGLRLPARLSLLLLPAAALSLGIWQQRPLNPNFLAARYDWQPSILAQRTPYSPDRPASGVPGGPEIGQELARRADMPQPPESIRNLALLFPREMFVVRQRGITEDELNATPASGAAARSYLARKNYRTALSWIAVKHLFNTAAIQMDTTGALESCLLDMERCPHLSQCGMTTRAMFFTCAASPQNRALLDRWADERAFEHPTRESLRLMGDLYRRFGQPDQALVWYRRAEMPDSFMNQVRMERPLFHDGRISGVLTLNGKPIEGMQVGVVPHRLNGLPPDMEGTVLRARYELSAFAPYSESFPRFTPRPYAFRWISTAATTDANGRFTLTDLTEGDYYLVCTMPQELTLFPPLDPRLNAAYPTHSLYVSYKSPSVDTGVIAFQYNKAASAPQ